MDGLTTALFAKPRVSVPTLAVYHLRHIETFVGKVPTIPNVDARIGERLAPRAFHNALETRVAKHAIARIIVARALGHLVLVHDQAEDAACVGQVRVKQVFAFLRGRDPEEAFVGDGVFGGVAYVLESGGQGPVL